MAPALTITDGALPDPLFRRVLAAVRGLGESALRTTYQTTFWFPAGAEPACVVEEAVRELWPCVWAGSAVHQAAEQNGRSPATFTGAAPAGGRGAEWWLSRMRTSNVQVDFHRDRDEKLALRTGRQVHPSRSSVLFLNRCRGGLLAVTEALPNPENESFAPDRLELDLVKPEPNRFVVFDGALTHGVLDAENQVPGRRLRREPALRLAVIINFWAKRPEGTPTFGESRAYPALRKKPRRDRSRVIRAGQ
ncbi:MAG: hypothetical protein JNK82_07445 [Myxococcaceae bacterium]|nr:hypothetical protein [Myxococcaceae bacterium]